MRRNVFIIIFNFIVNGFCLKRLYVLLYNLLVSFTKESSIKVKQRHIQKKITPVFILNATIETLYHLY